MIDFGLAFYLSSEERKKGDFESLDQIIPIASHRNNSYYEIQNSILYADKDSEGKCNESKWNNHSSSSDEMVANELVLESDDTAGYNKVDYNSKARR